MGEKMPVEIVTPEGSFPFSVLIRFLIVRRTYLVENLIVAQLKKYHVITSGSFRKIIPKYAC